MNVTVTPTEVAMLRRLADAALQDTLPDPSFSPDDVRAFVHGACMLDSRHASGYQCAVAETVLEHLNGHTASNLSEFVQHLCRRAEAIFGRPQPAAQAQAQPAAVAPVEPPVRHHVGMTVLDYQDDNALRFVQRVLESDAPQADRKAARDMIVEIRTRLRRSAA